VISEGTGGLSLADRLLFLSAHTGYQDCVTLLSFDFLGDKLEQWLEKPDGWFTYLELCRVHGDSNSSDPGIEIITDQRTLMTFIEFTVPVKTQRQRRNCRSKAQR
jgi:hypothetical protein